jgi:hypothetical protein
MGGNVHFAILAASQTFAKPSFANVITAISSLFIAITGLVVALPVLIKTLRIAKETHKIVNQQQTDLRNYQAALVSALHKAGVDVPADQAHPEMPTPPPPPT